METKHTPGPWSARIQKNKYHKDLGWIVEFEGGRIGWPSLAYASTNEEADANDPAREANAKLIAAAPELLAALQKLHASLTELNDCGDAGRMVQDDVETARAAIALVLG